MLIAGDIGGTKTNIALFKSHDAPLNIKRYPSHNYPNLRVIIEEYLKETNTALDSLTGACFAVAGPVLDGVCRATNLPWVVEAKVLEERLGFKPVYLINDLEANAYSIPILPPSSLITISEGAPYAQGNRAIISPGTGLGEAGMYWDGENHHPFASEGGHCEFGPRDEQELRLSAYLMDLYGHASYERILSGPGIVNLFHFLIDREGRKIPSEINPEEVTAREITALALERQESTCVETLRLFVSILGAECSNAVLKYFSLGGIYLGGGIPPKILPMIESPYFLEGFFDKGRFRSLIERVPVRVINDDRASLKGAAYYCETRLKKGERCPAIKDSSSH